VGHKRKSFKASPVTKRAKRKGEPISRPGPQLCAGWLGDWEKVFVLHGTIHGMIMGRKP
jgi:hypothetical protein